MSNSLNEVEKLSPREFARIIKQYEGQIARIKQEKVNLLSNLTKAKVRAAKATSCTSVEKRAD